MSGRRWPRWLAISALVVAVVLVLALAALIGIGWYVKSQVLDSGGGLPPAMAAYDVRHYDLAVKLDPAARSLRGRNSAIVIARSNLNEFELHLDGRLEVSRMQVDGVDVPFDHSDGVIGARLPDPWREGSRHTVLVEYAGKPKVALRPPWIDGFVWSETGHGEPWIGVTCQGDGADIWWPCKDHPSDEPEEGMDIAVTVPSGLVALSNGRFMTETTNPDGTVKSAWHVSYPINNYLVTVNVAPYVPITTRYHGIHGDLDIPITFWALPDSVPAARAMWQQMPRILEVLGRRFGEYPFLGDKFAVAQAPYYGMEHQTLVAYGAMFTDNDYGFDELLLHEVAHEWWGNKVTAADWSHFWLHEGFATYAESLFVLDTLGEGRALQYLAEQRTRIRNSRPLVRDDGLTAAEAYSTDIYFKGAWVLHTLRWLMGDDAFFAALWRFANDPDDPYRLVVTDDFVDLVSEISGRRFDWFWRRYLYRAALPVWRVTRSTSGDHEIVTLEWDDSEFELPLPVRIAGELRRVEMPGGRAELEVPTGSLVQVDPEGRVLAENRSSGVSAVND